MTDKKKFVLFLSGFLIVTLMFPLVSLITPAAASPDAGDSWSAPVDLNVAGIDRWISFNDRDIAVDAAGNVHIAMYGWTNILGENNEVFYVTNEGGSWSTVDVSQVGVSGCDQNKAVIALDSDGVVHIAWTGYPVGAVSRDIFYSNNQGGSFSTPYNVTNTAGVDERDPTIFIDSQDGVHFAFPNTTGGDAIMYAYRSPSGVWSGVQTVNSGTFDSVTNNDVAIVVDSDGKAHIAFIALVSANRDVFLCDNVGGSWSAPYNVSADYDSTLETRLSMDIDNNDQIHLGWTGTYGVKGGAYYTSGAGTSFSTPLNLSVVTGGINDLSLKVDYSNNAHIVFSQDYGPRYGLYYINNTAGFNQAVLIGSPTNDWRLPHLQIDHSGYAHLIYYMDTRVIYYLNSTEPVGIIPQLSLSSPSDQQVTLGEDAEITWVVTSTAYPRGGYQLILDGGLIDSGTWNNGENLILTVTNPSQVGTYNVTVYVEDGYGNSLSDQVQLQVNAPPADYTLPIIIGGVVGAVVIVGVAAFLLRGRKPT
jgi:hypothetical protein